MSSLSFILILNCTLHCWGSGKVHKINQSDSSPQKYESSIREGTEMLKQLDALLTEMDKQLVTRESKRVVLKHGFLQSAKDLVDKLIMKNLELPESVTGADSIKQGCESAAKRLDDIEHAEKAIMDKRKQSTEKVVEMEPLRLMTEDELLAITRRSLQETSNSIHQKELAQYVDYFEEAQKAFKQNKFEVVAVMLDELETFFHGLYVQGKYAIRAKSLMLKKLEGLREALLSKTAKQESIIKESTVVSEVSTSKEPLTKEQCEGFMKEAQLLLKAADSSSPLAPTIIKKFKEFDLTDCVQILGKRVRTTLELINKAISSLQPEGIKALPLLKEALFEGNNAWLAADAEKLQPRVLRALQLIEMLRNNQHITSVYKPKVKTLEEKYFFLQERQLNHQKHIIVANKVLQVAPRMMALNRAEETYLLIQSEIDAIVYDSVDLPEMLEKLQKQAETIKTQQSLRGNDIEKFYNKCRPLDPTKLMIAFEAFEASEPIRLNICFGFFTGLGFVFTVFILSKML